MCLIGEPTLLRPVLGHKGKAAMRCQVKGHACHSAYAPSGVNAIEYAARLIGKLNEIGERLARPQHHDGRFDPPFSTVQTGTIAGGRALNIVPAECEFDFEVRALPGFDPGLVQRELRTYADRELLPRMQAVNPETGIEMRPLSAYPGLATGRTAKRRACWRNGAVRTISAPRPMAPKGAVQPFGHPHGDMRAGQHGPGAQAR